jgi:hypothetical protein
MAWDFPERPDLIALITVSERLNFLRDHLKSLCGLWDRLPRRFLHGYFAGIAECIAQNRSGLEALAAAHGGLFRPEDWSYVALCPLPQARLPVAPETTVDFAFWTGEELCAVEIVAAASQSRARREGRERLKEAGIPVVEFPGAELERGQARGLIARLPAPVVDFWKTVPLPSSPFRIGGLGEIR